MWKRFTERARRAVFYSQEEAGRLGDNYVSTEHLLLGMIRDEEQSNVACQILEHLEIKTTAIREAIYRQIARGDGRTGQDMQLTPRAKRVVDLAYSEARDLDNNYIGTEHLLLGLIAEGDGLAARVLIKLGATLDATRVVVLELQREAAAQEAESASQPTIPQKEKVEPQKEQKIDGAFLEGRVRALLTTLRQTNPLLFLLEGNDDLAREIKVRLQSGGNERAVPGDLGVAQARNKRQVVEIASDAETFRALVATYQAKDVHGYRQLTHGDQSLFLVPDGTPLKRLVTSNNQSIAPTLGGIWVRVLGGEYEGYAGWMFADNFVRTGPDNSPFPPSEETDLREETAL